MISGGKLPNNIGKPVVHRRYVDENENLLNQVNKKIVDIQKINSGIIEQLQKLNTEINRTKTHPMTQNSNEIGMPLLTNNAQNTHHTNTTTDNETELVILMDSNSKFIDFRKLWTINKTKIKRCGNLDEITTAISANTKYTHLKYILISVGVNDIDESNGVAVFNKINQLIVSIQGKHPGIKIILSKITPRKDTRDSEVQICNRLIRDLALTNTSSLYIARHDNLRDPQGSFLYDVKHKGKLHCTFCIKHKKSS